jgi:hypothetical protein
MVSIAFDKVLAAMKKLNQEHRVVNNYRKRAMLDENKNKCFNLTMGKAMSLPITFFARE